VNGGLVDIRYEGLLQPLKGKTVIAIEHAAILEIDSEDPLVDTSCLVFTLEDGRRWELLDAVDSDMGLLVCKQIRGDDDLVTSFDRAREHGERASTVPIRGHDLKVPWTIARITEVWAPRLEPPYFRGAAFWAKGDYTDHALFTMFCSADEGFMIMPMEQWREYLHFDQVFDGAILYHNY
jgi:hypothetical protein